MLSLPVAQVHRWLTQVAQDQQPTLLLALASLHHNLSNTVDILTLNKDMGFTATKPTVNTLPLEVPVVIKPAKVTRILHTLAMEQGLVMAMEAAHMATANSNSEEAGAATMDIN